MVASVIRPGARIGFIGTGVMGSSMGGRLLDAGFNVMVFNRSPEKILPLVEKGARRADSVREVSAGQDAVITIVGFPRDVEEVYLGEGGILESVDSGTIVADMTTSSPRLAGRIAEAGILRGIPVLDAPVSGGDVGAHNGALSIMVGGDETAFDAMKEVFAVMGSRITYDIFRTLV